MFFARSCLATLVFSCSIHLNSSISCFLLNNLLQEFYHLVYYEAKRNQTLIKELIRITEGWSEPSFCVMRNWHNFRLRSNWPQTVSFMEIKNLKLFLTKYFPLEYFCLPAAVICLRYVETMKWNLQSTNEFPKNSLHPNTNWQKIEYFSEHQICPSDQSLKLNYIQHFSSKHVLCRIVWRQVATEITSETMQIKIWCLRLI